MLNKVLIGAILTLCVALFLGGLYLRTTLENKASLEAQNAYKTQVIEDQKKELEEVSAEIILRSDLAEKYRKEKVRSDDESKELQKQLKDIQNEVKDACYDLSPNPSLRMYEGNNQDKD